MLKKILLTLARCPEFPEGSDRHGYIIVAPLGSDGRLDLAASRALKDKCSVRYFAPDQADRVGRLKHRRGGADGATWVVDYDPLDDADDEAGFRLECHRFILGELISLRSADGKYRTYRVSEVRDA